jgi:ferredoxin-type protein NapF
MAERNEKYYRACLEHYSVSRRGLLRGLFSGANKAVQVPDDISVKRSVPRPPGAVEEGVFLQLCQSCNNCETACVQQVIEMVEGRPQLNLDYNHCTQCSECQKACLSGALSSTNNDIGLRPLFSKGCNNRLSGECLICVDACPQQAISISPRQLPAIDEDLCSGCGQCRSACFIGAIQLEWQTARH